MTICPTFTRVLLTMRVLNRLLKLREEKKTLNQTQHLLKIVTISQVEMHQLESQKLARSLVSPFCHH